MSTLIFEQHFTAFMYVHSEDIDLDKTNDLIPAKQSANNGTPGLTGINYHSRAGERVALLIEQIGGSLFIHRYRVGKEGKHQCDRPFGPKAPYRYRVGKEGKHQCELNSRSEGLLAGKRTIWSVARRVEIQHYTERTCQLHHWLSFILLNAPGIVQPQYLRGLSDQLDGHFRNETLLMAENIERMARSCSGRGKNIS